MTINGINIETFGMILLRGGDVDFFAFPERKEPPQNDWFEQDGLDVDLSESFFNARKIAFKFRLKAISTADLTDRFLALETLLYASGAKSIYLSNLNKTLTLRFISVSDFKFKGGLHKPGAKIAEFTCEFSEDNPLGSISGTMIPTSLVNIDNHVKLNGYDFSNFGIIVKKMYDSALCLRSPKKGLERTFLRHNGVVADTNLVPKKQARNISIECRMTAATVAELWSNWSALFNQLNRYDAEEYKDGIKLLINNSDLRYCFYKSMSNVKTNITIGNQPVVSFTLNLVNHK